MSLLMSWVSPKQPLQDCAGANLSGEGGMQRRSKVAAASGLTFAPVDFTWFTMDVNVTHHSAINLNDTTMPTSIWS